MKLKKMACAVVIGFMTACSTLSEHAVLQDARTQYELQIKNAHFAQSFIDVPETTMQNLVWWRLEDKIKTRDENINGCLSNARLYNRLAAKFDNLNKSHLPKKLDAQACYTECTAFGKSDKTCYIDTSKKQESSK